MAWVERRRRRRQITSVPEAKHGATQLALSLIEYLGPARAPTASRSGHTYMYPSSVTQHAPPGCEEKVTSFAVSASTQISVSPRTKAMAIDTAAAGEGGACGAG
jgi:4-aminobutyrate aminotransferase-like enzyme